MIKKWTDEEIGKLRTRWSLSHSDGTRIPLDEAADHIREMQEAVERIRGDLTQWRRGDRGQDTLAVLVAERFWPAEPDCDDPDDNEIGHEWG